ncbi:MAG: hypothetical protein CVU84_13025 [Firmicutes bacterium HGW-Firmicutes-1]|jgi:uncharacterized membrane protein|nr:MAG: hypothetical protein CVU84_13025 [Firmicutes bacterium HGW-Firmicutes-1]
MLKDDYLENLDRLLTSLPYNERRDIMYDYEEHFKEELKEGTSEEDVITALGSPEKIALQYVAAIVPVVSQSNQNTEASHIDKPKPTQTRIQGNSIGEIVALSIVALILNSIFIGFYIAAWGILIGFTVAGIGLVFGGFALLISSLIATPVAFLSAPVILYQYPILLFAISIILICIGGLMLIIMYFLIRFTCIYTYKYVKWLIKLIRGF